MSNNKVWGTATLRVLEVSASGRTSDSVSRMLTQDIVDAIENREGKIEVTRRDLSRGISLIDAAWIDANFTPEEARTRRPQGLGRHDRASPEDFSLYR
jgi:FMN-dependent NADH-azoreductase